MPNYQAMLDEVLEDFNRLAILQHDTETRMAQLQQLIESLQTLALEEQESLVEPPAMSSDEERGFTDRIREILKSNSIKRLVAVEIRDVLMKQMPDADPRIVLIHTHNTLKRLHSQNEVEETKLSDGRKAYQWKAPILKRGSLRTMLEELAKLDGLSTPEKKIGVDPKPDAAFESGIRGNEKPKK